MMKMNRSWFRQEMGRLVVAAAAVLLLAGAMVPFGFAQSAPSADTSDAPYPVHAEIERRVDNLAFGVGEWLQFDLGYGFINAGTATIEVQDVVDYGGRPAYLFVSTANSNKFFSSFYPIEDRVESITDAIGLFAWRFEKNLREGKYRANRKYNFDQVNHTVVYRDDTIQVAPYVQDALSVLFYVRTQKLEVGQSIFVDNFTDGKNYPLEVKVHRREKLKTKAGEFTCLVVEPLLKAAGLFQHEGKLTVWLTDDRLHLPVLMKSKVVVGSITAELTDYRLGQLEEF
jgi:hypothetical protein